jgi:hypothetical protein
LRLGFLTVDRGSIRGRPAYAVPLHWLADQLCDAVSAENNGGEASRNDGKKRRGCCDVFYRPAPRPVNGSRTSSRRRNSRARLRRRAQSRSRERQRGRHVSIYKPLTVIRCLPRLAKCHLRRRSSTEEESRLWRQIANSEAQQDEVPEKPGADPAGTLC